MTLLASLIIFISLFILLFLGIPIAVVIGISSILAILPTLDVHATLLTGAQRIFSGISVFTLIAIPFFILAGNIMNKGGIAIRLINFAKLLIGKVPGGLAHTNILANAIFGAISGSGVAAASAMGSIIGPVEEKEGYDKTYSAAANIASAPAGLLIPPSNVLITYSLASGGTSIAALFLGGYIPGMLWAVACMIVAYILAKKKGYVAAKEDSGMKKLNVFLQALPALLLIIIVIGGIIAGIFTATEGSIVAVVYSLILSLFIYKTITIKELPTIFKESAEISGIIIFLIGASSIMAWVLSFTGIPEAVASLLLTVSTNRYVIFMIINIILLIVGTFMDITPAILIFTPIFLPVCEALGMSSVHFGILLVLNLCIGTITPPVGNILFVGVRIADIDLESVIKPIVLYFVALVVVLLVVTYVPFVTMWLPQLAGY